MHLASFPHWHAMCGLSSLSVEPTGSTLERPQPCGPEGQTMAPSFRKAATISPHCPPHYLPLIPLPPAEKQAQAGWPLRDPLAKPSPWQRRRRAEEAGELAG